jgi:uncharacterized protein YndB with AHSA1/START domain
MTLIAERSVSASIEVAAPPEAVFALLADPHRHPEIDGSGTLRRTLSGPHRLALGDTFGMRMQWGLPYVMRNTVVELEPDRLIAWRHPGRHRWRYTLEPTGTGTRVTETFDWSTTPLARVLERLQVPARNLRSIEATLQRLKAVAERG